MKVLQLTKNYPPQFGGIESVTFDMTEGLNDAGIPCDVMCSSVSARTSIEKKGSYTIFRMATLRNIAATSISPAIISKLRIIQSDYDIVQLHFPNPMVALALLFVSPKMKVVVHWHSDIIRQRFIYPLFRPLERWVLKRADAIVATSENYISGSLPLKSFREKTISIPLGISTERLVSNPLTVTEIRRKWANKKIVFSLGRLVYYKGFEHLIAASEHISDDTVVLIAGAGELKEKLEKEIQERQLQDKVILLGRISDEVLGSYYEACDVFCLPSVKRSEAFGVVQLEAMYFGKPIVATEISGSGVSWVNLHGITGYNVPTQNPAALASALTSVVDNPELAKRLGENARKRFEQNFTRAHMVNAFIDLYRRLLNSSK